MGCADLNGLELQRQAELKLADRHVNVSCLYTGCALGAVPKLS